MIQTRALGLRYPRGPALAFPDIDLAQGAVLLLRGNSGAGKSTWLALVAGLLTPTEGDLTVAGQPLAPLAGSARDRWRGRSIGFLPQKLHLSEALTVQANLALAYFAAGLPEDRRAIGDALGAQGVAELAQRRPSQLSGGQAQRVALARSLLLRPRVILADEPTASLDDAAAADALSLLAQGARDCQATLVIATHDRRVHDAFSEATVYALAAQPVTASGAP